MNRACQAVAVMVLVSVTLSYPGQTGAADWPHFRGPAYDGNSPDEGLSAEKASEVWSTSVHNGSSSVSIVDGKLYTMGNEKGRESVVSLDAATGNELWRFSYDCELMPRLYDGGPNATPTVDDGRVYTISRTGQIFCLDAAGGKKLWEASAEGLASKGGWWGFSGSPTVVGQVVLFNVGGKGLALDKATGKTVWSSEKPAKAYSTVVPLPENVLGRPAVIVQTTTQIQIVDPGTGKRLVTQTEDWRTRKSSCNGVSPRWYDGALYTLHGKHGLSRLSVDGGTWSEDWLCKEAKFRNDWFAFNQAVFHDAHVFVIVGGAQPKCRLICVDTQTGQVVWDKPVEFGNLILAGDTLLMLSQSGELAWATLSGSEYDEQQRIKPLEGDRARGANGLYWPYPVLLDGRLYAKTTKGHLTCLKFE